MRTSLPETYEKAVTAVVKPGNETPGARPRPIQSVSRPSRRSRSR